MAWGTLGDITFQAAESPRSLRYSEATEFSQHPKLDRKPTLQRIGESLQSLNLSFRFGIGWGNPDQQLRRLQQARQQAEPMTLVLGAGTIAGNYVIESIDVNVRQTDAEGNLQTIEVAVALIETSQLPSPNQGTLFSQARPFEVRV